MNNIISIDCFQIDVNSEGVAHVVFSRPPVNAISLSVYQAIGDLVTYLENRNDIRVVILTASEKSRCWCGGADLNDFKGMNKALRKQRYAFINSQLPRFFALKQPVIAAINGDAIGIGFIWAGLCDLRIASEDAHFACPEIQFGLIAGGGGLMSMLKFPEAKMREMLYTGMKFSARDLEPTGFFNYVVPADQIQSKALAIAKKIASHAPEVLFKRKLASNRLENRNWMDAYLDAQALSADLVELDSSQQGVESFFTQPRETNKDQ
jgi:enoyl-CoA hydratase/carnithine racemase